MTVAIACQRFLAIRYPFKYGRKSKNQVTIYVSSVSILALITTISAFFEFKVDYFDFTMEYGNLTDYDYEDPAQNQTTYTEITDTKEMEAFISPTNMKDSLAYKAYESIGVLIIFGIVPFALLICFYIGIYQGIKANNSRTAALNSNNENNRKKEATLAKTFAAFVIVFFICYTPQHVYRIYEIVLFDQTTKCGSLPFWSAYGLEITHVLIVLNSAINVVIYTAFNNQFRNECKKMFGELRGTARAITSSDGTRGGPSTATVTTDTGVEMQKLKGHDRT